MTESKDFNTELELHDNLRRQLNTMVGVSLKSGEKLSGNVKSVGKHFLLLSELSGHEFYDGLVRIADISAVEKKVRDS